MPCYSPIQGWRSKRTNPSGKRSIVFNKSEGFSDSEVMLPCGQCIGCKLEHSRQWAVRCMHESQMHDKNCFITLTYDDKNLPDWDSLEKSHLQYFMKRLRLRYGKGIKYYGCGEYGELNFRPHYHACLFGIDFEDRELHSVNNGNKIYTSKILSKLWPRGYASVCDFSFETAAYVARYCLKKSKEKAHYEILDPYTGEHIQLEQEFALMSRRPGIGKAWYEKFKKDMYPSDEIIVNGKQTKTLRYYDNLYEKENPDVMFKIKAKRRKEAKDNWYENSSLRLPTKEICKKAQIKQLKRSI